MNGMLVSLTLSAVLGGGGVPSWSDSYSDAYSQAKKSGQPLLVVFEKGNDPAGQLHQVSLTTDATSAALLEPYVLCRIDASKKEGRAIANLFRAATFPYTAIVDKHVKTIIYRKPGKVGTAEWVKMLVDYSSGTRPVTTFSSSFQFGSMRSADDCYT